METANFHRSISRYRKKMGTATSAEAPPSIIQKEVVTNVSLHKADGMFCPNKSKWLKYSIGCDIIAEGDYEVNHSNMRWSGHIIYPSVVTSKLRKEIMGVYMIITVICDGRGILHHHPKYQRRRLLAWCVFCENLWSLDWFLHPCLVNNCSRQIQVLSE